MISTTSVTTTAPLFPCTCLQRSFPSYLSCVESVNASLSRVANARVSLTCMKNLSHGTVLSGAYAGNDNDNVPYSCFDHHVFRALIVENTRKWKEEAHSNPNDRDGWVRKDDFRATAQLPSSRAGPTSVHPQPRPCCCQYALRRQHRHQRHCEL